MHEIECILHEYLSFNWDRVENIYEANAPYLDENGLRCSWKSHSSLQARTLFHISGAPMKCHAWQHNLITGGSTHPCLSS